MANQQNELLLPNHKISNESLSINIPLTKGLVQHQRRIHRVKHHIRRCHRWKLWHMKQQQFYREQQRLMEKKQEEKYVKECLRDQEFQKQQLKEFEEYDREKMNRKERWEQEQIHEFEVIMELEDNISKMSLTI